MNHTIISYIVELYDIIVQSRFEGYRTGEHCMRKRKYNEDVELQFVYPNAFNKLWELYELSDADKKDLKVKSDYMKKQIQIPIMSWEILFKVQVAL